MSATVLIGDEVVITKKGSVPDPAGSKYCVVDYVNDEAAKIAARTLATTARDREPAFADALYASLEGAEQAPPLLVYGIEPRLTVHPDARFAVFNYSRHYPSRVAMRMYWLKVKDERPGLAERLDWELDTSEEDFATYVQSKYPDKKKSKKGRRRK